MPNHEDVASLTIIESFQKVRKIPALTGDMRPKPVPAVELTGRASRPDPAAGMAVGPDGGAARRF